MDTNLMLEQNILSRLRLVESRLGRIEAFNLDMKKRRVVNASDAKDAQDYITLNQVTTMIDSLKSTKAPAAASSTAVGLKHSFAYNSNAQTIATATQTPLDFDTNISDPDSLHSTSTDTERFVCKESGIYLAICQLVYPPSAAGDIFEVHAFINGSASPNQKGYTAEVAHSVTIYPVLTLIVPYVLAIDDYVSFVTVHDDAGSVNTVGYYTIGGIVKVA